MVIKFENINYSHQPDFIFALTDAGYKVWIEKTYKEWPYDNHIDHLYVCVEMKDI